MKKNILFAIAGLASTIFSSCTVVLPHDVSDAKVGSKVGTSKTTIILGTLYLNSNFGLTEAVKNGKITGGVATIDNKFTNFYFFATKEIIVTGE